MLYEKIDLYRYFSLEKPEGRDGTLTVYVPEKKGDLRKKSRPAMLINPGGGYSWTSDREAEPVAMRFLNAGYGAFVLRYSVNVAYPVPLLEAGMAMVYIRENAEKYSVDPSHVGAVGFSAGGHLTGMLATLFADEHLRETLGERAKLVRPDAVVLSYPVITTIEAETHGGTAGIISGGDKELRNALSLETRVTKDSVPAFLWHTYEDDCVPVVNSLLFANAYREHGVPFELHIFERGWHGLSVANIETDTEETLPKISHVAVWVDLALCWLKQRGFVVSNV